MDFPGTINCCKQFWFYRRKNPIWSEMFIRFDRTQSLMMCLDRRFEGINILVRVMVDTF